MKTKTLLTLAVSLFCFEGLSRGRSVVRPAEAPQTPQTRSAFKAEIPLNPAGSCGSSCVVAARETLTPEATRLLNETPVEDKADFMGELPRVFGALTVHHAGPGSSLGIAGANAQLGQAKQEALGSTTALAAAIQRSFTEVWSEPAKESLARFVKGIGDGVSQEEAEKLREVRENCTI